MVVTGKETGAMTATVRGTAAAIATATVSVVRTTGTRTATTDAVGGVPARRRRLYLVDIFEGGGFLVARWRYEVISLVVAQAVD